MKCSAVTRRASEGPCQYVGGGVRCHLAYEPRTAPHRTLHTFTAESHKIHVYLGPVLERCGHEESEHEAGIEFGDVIDDMCHSCYGGAWHAFEEES